MLISRNGTDFFLWLNMALMSVLNGVQRLRVYSLFVARGKRWRLSGNNGLAGVILHPLTMPSHNQTRVSSPAVWPSSETSVLFSCIQPHNITTLHVYLASDKKIKVIGLFFSKCLAAQFPISFGENSHSYISGYSLLCPF